MDAVASTTPAVMRTSYNIIFAVSASHLINDLLQFLLPALYPLLKGNYQLDYLQIGLLTLAQQITACILQPLLGLYGDVRPKPYMLAVSLTIVAAGVVLLALATSFPMLLLASAIMGVGSALFHPEASRVARLASGGKLGFAQSTFQVGGNAGTAIGPLAAALIVLPLGQASSVWFGLVAVAGVLILTWVGRWYAAHQRDAAGRPKVALAKPPISRQRLVVAFAVIGALLLSKYVYIDMFKNYYTFYLIERFGLPVQQAQYLLFAFLGAIAVGTFFGGPLGDRFGRLAVIWGSIVGALPFAVMIPFANLHVAVALSIVVGLILSSAFSAIVVYAQELIPGKVGLISGFVFGFAFGIGALGAAVLGALADRIGMTQVFALGSFLPVLGFLTIFLPTTAELHRKEPA
ncbi:MAG TPA: MFS transporter [Devosia sp.]|jgi:FSR family fosmidomycin resistance protein-like MFS transporter|uniref:MFS transporter n=1 Tax=Devosia sp. TaxID=1871048 RepID=UPI002F950DC9